MSEPAATPEAEALWTPSMLAARWQMSKDAVLDLYHRGAIPAEIAEGKVYRFDLAKVEAALAKRAKKRVTKNLPPAAGTAGS